MQTVFSLARENNIVAYNNYAYYIPAMTTSTDSADSFGFLLSDTARMLRRRFDHKARVLGLSRAQWQVLAHLTRHEGLNQAELADLLELKPISLCRLIDRMEEGRWVARTVDPNDRRAKLIFMTDKARGIFSQMRVMADEIYSEALDGLPEGVRAQLMSSLSHIRANLAGN